ncbi:ATP-binding protein [Actinacidiphila rubida]|uniref:NB-ARC domain-containing protein n=1 Tax=Actinacidiphila rubida TaxID=310780 RepID=A0A1H8GER4_9ACTN|nr:helix-turn-helix domain-containing protein [Actinacidiphila rubida]SEN42280.1 NB-ARC domain-containing protein [Actinacidiphila rubida]
MDRGTLGPLLREARQRSLLTLEGLAEASGVSVRAISDIERGKRLPRQSTMNELLDALELDEDGRRRVVQASARRTGRTPQQLPPDLAVFRGRERALEVVRAFGSPAAGQAVICVIGGMAGVGKTALAVHWAHQVADRFPDGQLYVNLRAFQDTGSPLDPGEALGGFLTALGVPSSDIPRHTEQRSALFRERTASRQLVVVLDNARDAEQVRPLLPASAGCLTIVTSRDQLPGLVATEGASLISLDVWTPAEALAGLAARIGEGRCAAEPEDAAELVELCGFLPLAVAIVGAQLTAAPGMPLRVGVRELRESQPRLDALAADDRRVDVRAVFSWSYRALTAETQQFFRYLSVHPGPALSAEAAACLRGTPMATARQHLRRLTSASLLSRDADGRYVLHDLVRAYGAELMDREGDDRAGAEIRLLDYLRHNAHAGNRFLWDYPSGLPDVPVPGVVSVAIEGREEALDWYRQEESTAAAALRSLDGPRLRRHRVDVALEWTRYHQAAGRWAEEIAAQGLALAAALALDDPVAIASICHHLAHAAVIGPGDAEEAERAIDLMLAYLPRLPLEQQVRFEHRVCTLRDHQGRYPEALRHARNSLAIARDLGRPAGIARGLSAVAWFLALLDAYQEAVDACEEALPILRELGDRGHEAGTWDTLGYARQRLGDLDTAIADYRTALGICEELQLGFHRGQVLDHLASALLERGDVEQARATWNQAAEQFTALRVARAAEVRARIDALPARPIPALPRTAP